MDLANVKFEWTFYDTSFFFLSFFLRAKGACLCDMQLSGIGTWLAPLEKKTEQVAKRRKQGRASTCCEHDAGVPIICNSKILKKQSFHTFRDTQKNIIIFEIYCRRTSFDSVFVVVFVIVAGSQFFMVAGPSVGAVKHSSVFSCDWDSLEKENVRHGAWLSVCWSSSRGLGEKWAVGDKPPLLIQPAPFFSSLSILLQASYTPLSPLICPGALCSILFSFLLSISQRGFISCDSLKPIISSPPTSILSQPLNNSTQPLDQSPERASSLIDAYQRIHCCWPVLPIPVVIGAAVTASLIVLYRCVVSPALFLRYPQKAAIIRCARQV